jgi:hypothetical protein
MLSAVVHHLHDGLRSQSKLLVTGTQLLKQVVPFVIHTPSDVHHMQFTEYDDVDGGAGPIHVPLETRPAGLSV